MPRARDLGITIGVMAFGPKNAITDVPGVRVGHATISTGNGPLVVGQGPVRTGVTLVLPHNGVMSEEPLFAGCHRLNGNGELTGLEWVRESGMFDAVVACTEEAILNCLLVAQTTVGRDGITAYILDGARLIDVMSRFHPHINA